MGSFCYHNADGVRRTSIADSSNPDRLIVHTEVDMDQVIENNKIMRDIQEKPSANGFRVLARGVPMTVVEKAMLEGWEESDWTKWLNDPDNAAFRIFQGTV